jgi:hypothetical protein
MIWQLVLGSLIISFVTALHAVFLRIAAELLIIHAYYVEKPPYLLNTSIALLGSSLWVLAALSVEVWIWALVLLLVGAFSGLEPAVYFALVTYTTLGYGDVVLGPEFRILGALVAANGLLVFGLSTAFLTQLMIRLHSVAATARAAKRQHHHE